MISMMLEHDGMGEHVDMGCVHENIEHIIAEHGTDGQLNLDEFITAYHEAEDPVGPCFTE